MSTQPAQGISKTVPTDIQEVKIVSHSNLFYWWPVWAIGFIMAILTFADGSRMAFVPSETKAVRHASVKVQAEGVTYDERDVLILPANAHLPPAHKLDAPPDSPHLHVASVKSYGVLYAIILLLVIVITNVPLRGLWSVVVIVTIVLLSIIFALAGWWDDILTALFRLHIHINAAGYLMISLALFVIWLVTFMFFDPQIYMVFTPGQLKVRTEIGGGEESFDTMGMHIQKHRNDLFRHWILGLGSGDLSVTTSGANQRHFELPNVLFVGYKVKQIEDMKSEKPVVQG
jgi:hypothetical protein